MHSFLVCPSLTRVSGGLAVLFVCLAGLAARAAEATTGGAGFSPPSLSLAQAVQTALEQNPELRIAGGRLQAARGRETQARALSNPELELRAEEWPVERSRGFSDAKQMIGVAQTVPFPGKKALERRAGTAGVRAGEAELAARRRELVREVRAAYCQVLAAERAASVHAELLQLAEASADAARKRVEAGDAALQEQLRASLQAEQARAETATARREVATARLSLATLLGRTDLGETRLTGTMVESAPALSGETNTAWLASHPRLRAAQANLERAELQARRARVEGRPDLTVGLAGGRLGETDESIIELRLAVPLPILDTGKGRRQEAQAEVEIAEAELAGVRQQLLSRWATAREHAATAAAQAAAGRERILPQADEALRLVQRGFTEGKFGFIDLLDTQRTVAEARLKYLEHLLDLNLALADLDALADSGSAPSVSPTH